MTADFLDFYDILVNQLIGDVNLALFIIIAIILLILVRARTPNPVMSLTVLACVLILATVFGFNNYLIVILLLGLAFTGWQMRRIGRE